MCRNACVFSCDEIKYLYMHDMISFILRLSGIKLARYTQYLYWHFKNCCLLNRLEFFLYICNEIGTEHLLLPTQNVGIQSEASVNSLLFSSHHTPPCCHLFHCTIMVYCTIWQNYCPLSMLSDINLWKGVWPVLRARISKCCGKGQYSLAHESNDYWHILDSAGF